MPTESPASHLVVSGNPGTGKTTVARILARIYKKLGILKKGHLVEVDRSKLVAGYVGQTAIQTNAVGEIRDLHERLHFLQFGELPEEEEPSPGKDAGIIV